MTNVLLLIAGGAAGTLLRFWVSWWLQNLYGGIFPWWTITINLSGSFVIGFLWGALDIDNLSPQVKNLVFVGILGGFTTFSAFSIETLNLLRAGEMKLAVFNIVLSNAGGLILVVGGFFAGRLLQSILK